MKKYETVQVPATTRQKLIHHTCDFCGQASSNDDWDGSYYNINETNLCVKIKHREGNNYGYDGSNVDEFSCDMCPDCFRDRLVPFLKSIAINPIDYEEFNY